MLENSEKQNRQTSAIKLSSSSSQHIVPPTLYQLWRYVLSEAKTNLKQTKGKLVLCPLIFYIKTIVQKKSNWKGYEKQCDTVGARC